MEHPTHPSSPEHESNKSFSGANLAAELGEITEQSQTAEAKVEPGDSHQDPLQDQPSNEERQPTQANAEISQTRETDPRKNTEFHYVLCNHIPENGEAVARNLVNCNVIAFEAITPEFKAVDKKLESDKYTTYISPRFPTLDEKTKEDVNDVVHANPFKHAVLEPLVGTGARVELIDVGADDTDAMDLKAKLKHIRSNYEEKQLSEAPNAEIQNLLLDEIEESANYDKIREQTIKKQLRDIAKESSADKPLRVGVVLGAAHTFVHRGLADEGYKSTKTYVIENDASSDPIKVEFSYKERARRQLVILPEKELDPELVDRTLLEEIYSFHNYRADMDTHHVNAGVNWKRPHGVIKKMSHERVVSLLKRVDEIKRQDTSITEKRSAVKIELLANILMTNKEIEEKPGSQQQ